MYRRLPAVLVLVLVGLIVPSLPANADSSVRLSTTVFVDMVVDNSHQLLFLSGGEETNAVEVRSFTGAFVKMVNGQADAAGMALSDDGSRLFVALTTGDAVSAIDTTTLEEVGRWSTGSSSCPSDLAWAGGRLWVGYGCSAMANGLSALDPSSPTATLGESILSTSIRPPGIVGGGDTLVAYDRDRSPNAFSFDVSSNPPVQLAQRTIESECHDASLDPGGSTVMLACGAHYVAVFRTSDLSADGVYPTTATATGVTSAADVVVTGMYSGDDGPDASVFARDGALPLRTLTWSGGSVPYGGLALSANGSRLFAVTAHIDEPLSLHIVPNPTLPPLTPSLTMSTSKAIYQYGATATVKAHLGPTNNSRVVNLYATPYGGTPQLLKSAPVDSGGNISASYVVHGTTKFTASFAGDDRYLPRSATSSVTSPARLKETLRRSYGKSGKYLLYRPTKDPLVRVRVLPATGHRGGCLRYHVQRKYDGAWHEVIRSYCFQVDADGFHAALVNGQHLVGSKYRIRVKLRASSYNLASVGAWKYFRFRR